MLPQVGAGAGHDDAQFVGVVAGELGCLGAARQLDRAFRAADAAFAVGDQRQAAATCCPSGGRPAVRRVPEPSRRSGRRRCRRPRERRRSGRSGRGRRGRGPAPPRDPRRGVRRPPPDAAPRRRRCAVQRREFAADLGRQLLGFDVGRDRRALRPWRLAVGCWAGRDGRGLGPTSAAPNVDRVVPVAVRRRWMSAAVAARRCRPACPGPRMPLYTVSPIPRQFENSNYELSANIESPPTQLWGVILVCVRRCPTFPPGLGSIIGAGRLSFRVRDGSGRFPVAITAVTLFFVCGAPGWGCCGVFGGGVWVVCVVWLRGFSIGCG